MGDGVAFLLEAKFYINMSKILLMKNVKICLLFI